ncbi:MAG: hypothetical protein KHX55_02080 [Proteobacteria bacterium]|nr:hypothetical protein [Pseudomonadota bacterium]
MSCTRIFKNFLLSASAVALLAGCAVLDKKNTDKESCWLVRQFEKDGNQEAADATMAYSQGHFKEALELSADSLKANPRNQQGLLVGALAAEQLGRLNRARANYEELIIIDSTDTSILGSSNGQPQPFADIAKTRLRNLTIKQSQLIVQAPNGTKSFNISPTAGNAQSKTTITRALQKKAPAPAKKAPAIDNLFSQQEQNIISRFLVLKELAEKDYVTKEEFLTRRMSNIGGLLPLTNTPPAAGIDQPVPAPELIVERINVLKEGVESRAITPREFSAERDVIIEALLPPSPRTRMKPKAPAKDILGAAKDLRKLEVLYDLNLITSAEKDAEKKAIEKYLGINRTPKKAAAPAVSVNTVAASDTVEQAVPAQPENLAPEVVEVKTSVQEVTIPVTPEINTVTKGKEAVALITKTETITPENPENTPNVSSPFK